MTIARLDDVAMDEVTLTTPVSDADVARLKLGDVVYLDGILYTAREGVYRKVVDDGWGLPESVRALTNVNFHCSPAASVRPDGVYAVEAVTATASFRFGKSMSRWFEKTGARVIVGKAGLSPFLVEGDREGRSLFALANREINARLREVYRDLPPFAMGRFGEQTSCEEEII